MEDKSSRRTRATLTFQAYQLPTVLTGHVVPHLAVASLIGIRPLCKAGCIVTFDNDKCDVSYNGKIILRGLKDPASDLWTLPINRKTCGPPFHDRPLLLTVPRMFLSTRRYI